MGESSTPDRPPAGRFTFVSVASARARQLLDGCAPRVAGSAKPARLAVEEVAAGVVQRFEPEEP